MMNHLHREATVDMTAKLVIGILFGLWSTAATAAIIRIGVTAIGEKRPGWEPRNITMARRVCERAGLTCEVLALTPQRGFTELHAGRIQFVMSLEPRDSVPEPIKLMRIRTSKIVILAKKPLDTCESLNGLHLAAINHTLYSQKLLERCPNVRLDWTNNYEQSMKMYRSGRVDGAIGVIMNFQNPGDPALGMQPDDIITLIDNYEQWLFGNPASRSSEAALRLQAAIIDLSPL